jgi:16S rRNA (cytidine1402-2'-O)-methyltransferase
VIVTMSNEPRPIAANLEDVMADRDAGTLFVVATPIGNLSDITQRAVDVLKRVAIVAAEDTRRSRVLLAHIGAVPRRLLSLHDHNERERADELLALLQQGHDVALISDAGTPLLSDPGFALVRMIRRRGGRIVPVPGPSAVMAALSVSSIPIERFLFEGFLPARPEARRKRIAELSAAPVAVVFFETARRMRACLRDVVDIVGAGRELLLAKELTKLHERVEVGAVGELSSRLEHDEFFDAGEFVGILAPPAAVAGDSAEATTLLEVLCEELPPAQAARLAARICKRPRRELYELALTMRRDSA